MELDQSPVCDEVVARSGGKEVKRRMGRVGEDSRGIVETCLQMEPEIPVTISPTNSAGLLEESEEIPTIELPGTSQAFDLKKIISTNISNILRTGLGESSDLTIPVAVTETAELEEFVEIPTIEPEILPGNRQGAVPTSSRVDVDGDYYWYIIIIGHDQGCGFNAKEKEAVRGIEKIQAAYSNNQEARRG
ncbi:hypothetical protein CBL_08580 [Carabus blaptoides fortunei]